MRVQRTEPKQEGSLGPRVSWVVSPTWSLLPMEKQTGQTGEGGRTRESAGELERGEIETETQEDERKAA